MAKTKLLTYLMIIGIAYVCGAGSAAAQYPSFNNGVLITGTTTGAPVRNQIRLPGGAIITSNGMQPGAQVNAVLVQDDDNTWSQGSYAYNVENAIGTGVSQSWAGTPYADFPPVISSVVESSPAADPNTGIVGASASNVIAVVQLVSPSVLSAECGDTDAAACTTYTMDLTTGYATSVLTFMSTENLSGPVGEHEVVGHGLDNLSDCTSCSSLMGSSTDTQTVALTPSDISIIESDTRNPVPPPPPSSCP